MLRKNNNRGNGARPRLVVRAIAVAALLGLAAGLAHAGSDGRKGTAGAAELQIPVGARGVALGSAVAADVDGAEAMFYNPAGMSGLGATDVLFSHTQYFADMRMNFAGVATKAGGLGVIGLSAKVLSVGDIVVTTEQAPDGTGEILTPTFSVLGLSWAKAFTDRVNFGATMNYVNENIANNTANGVAFDFGVQYSTDWNGFKLGMAIKNIGTSMRFSGPGFEILTRDPAADPNAGNRGWSISSSSFEMPSYFTLASCYDVARTPQQKLTLVAAFQNNNFSGDNVRGGLEWTYRDLVMLRGSYFGTFNGTIDQRTGDETFKFEAGDDLYEGVALGAGLQTRVGDAAKLGVDVSWRPLRQGFDDILDVGVHMHF